MKLAELTRDMVLSEPAGKRLDEWVAKMVMGYTIVATNSVFWHENAPFPFMMYDEYLESYCLYERYDNGYPFSVFSPSTDMSAAWDVQEKLRDTGGIDLGCYKNSFEVYVIRDGFEIRVTAETAPIAICRTALIVALKGGE